MYIIYYLTISSETSSCLTAGSGGDHCLIAGSTGITTKGCDTIGIIGGMCGGGSNVTPGSAGVVFSVVVVMCVAAKIQCWWSTQK